MLALVMVCLGNSMLIPTYAKEVGKQEVSVTYSNSNGGAEFVGDSHYNPLTKRKIQGIFDSYNLTSYKTSTKYTCTCEEGNGYDFKCTGWVNITDKKSGTALRHSTTAALSNLTSGNMYKGAVRVVGYGKVSATSKLVHGWSVPRIFWNWVK